MSFVISQFYETKTEKKYQNNNLQKDFFLEKANDT